MQITLRQMQVFLAVARTENLSVAAQDLAMSKSAVSQALTELEGRLGVTLFERTRGRLLLSAEGRRLKPAADELMERTFTIGSFMLSDLMRDFQAHAGWMPEMRIANTAEVAESLLNFSTDISIVEGPVTNPHLITEPWISDEMVVVAPKGHRLTQGVATWEQLSRERWILREEGSSTRIFFDAQIGLHLSEHNIIANVNSFEAIVGMIINGMGLTFISERILHDPFFGPHLRRVKCPETFTRQLSFCMHKQKYRSSDLQAFLAFCRLWGEQLLEREHSRRLEEEQAAMVFTSPSRFSGEVA